MTIDQLSWLNQDQPFSNIFEDVYFDSENGLAESKYVFIKNNNLAKRFNQLGSQDQFVIGETGFGTGLNFLSVARLWHKLITNDAKLHYIAFEKKPLNPEQIQRALKKWPILLPYLDKLLAHYPCRYSAFHQFSFSSQIYVTLVFKDVADGLSQTYDFVDAWFLDGFAPSKNPSMWQNSVFFHMARLSHLNTTVATFTSSGHVRRSLADFGFVPRKVKGFQNKREMLVAYYSPTKNQRYFTISPYYKPSKISNLKSKHIAVIGAGLAGLACAYELSFSTHRIDIYEQGQAIASGASCCPAGILKPYLTVDGNASEVFHTTGFIQMQKLCHAFKLQYPELIYSQGVFQPLIDRIDKRRFEKLFAQRKLSESLAYLISPERFAELTGTSSHYGGIYYPSALSVNVHLLCQIIYKQLGNNAHLYTGACVDDIHLNNTDGEQKWCVKANNKNHYYDNVILASGYQTVKHFHQTQYLPLYTSIGQSTFLSNGDKVKCNLIDKGYLIPLNDQEVMVGATHRANDEHSLSIKEKDHKTNLSKVKQIANFTMTNLTGAWVGQRAVTTDHLPLIGELPDYQVFYQQYEKLLYKGVTKKELPDHANHQGLYIATGFGSKGMSASLLAGKLMASLINNHPLPISTSVYQALHPARFWVRQMKKS